MNSKLAETYSSREAENMTAYYFDAVKAVDKERFEFDIKSLINGVPVQYVTRTSFFYGHKLFVDNRVLIPRPETEELVHWMIADVGQKALSILDIGTGSGCILLSVLKKAVNSKGTGLDVSSDALDVFDINKGRLKVNAQSKLVNVLDQSSMDALGKFDVIVSNPPYILETEKQRMGYSVVEHEPHVSLFVEQNDPLVFYKRIMELGITHLHEHGTIYFETSDLYHDEMEALAAKYPYESTFKKDLQGNWRMLKLGLNRRNRIVRTE